jgi:hypothetical protein
MELYELDYSGSEQGEMAGYCEHGNERSGFHNILRKFLSIWAIGGFQRKTQLHLASERVSR